ncbi:MAG: HAD family hydrolase [Firmicutes bacterium]|nr:HAD family hydrolase [Bacillota bacterium]
MENYLIALDLDGTLLYDFDSLSEELCLFMKKLQNLGHKIVIATGRPYRSSRFVYERFGLDTPIINYNGGLITHPHDNTFPEVNYTVKKEAIIDIFENNVKHIRNAFSEVKDNIYLFKEEKAIEPLLHITKDSLLFLGHLKDTLKEDPNGFIIIGKQGQGKHIETYVNQHYKGKVLSRIWDLKGEFDSIVEIFTPESNKGKGLKVVSEFLGFPQERVIAIGDGHNDIEMIQFAGIGVAVKNAHPDLLKVTKIILPFTARENAVTRYLTDFFHL